MDSIMNQRWQSGQSPFDGDCLVADESLSVAELRALLIEIVSDLKGHYAAQKLYMFDDWHQHDGYVTERRATDWDAFAEVLGSDEAWTSSYHGDTYVHRSYYPEDFAFLLRYDIGDEYCEDMTSFGGTFDISASSNEIARLAELIPLSLRPRVRIEPAKSYFDETYAG